MSIKSRYAVALSNVDILLGPKNDVLISKVFSFQVMTMSTFLTHSRWRPCEPWPSQPTAVTVANNESRDRSHSNHCWGCLYTQGVPDKTPAWGSYMCTLCHSANTAWIYHTYIECHNYQPMSCFWLLATLFSHIANDQITRESLGRRLIYQYGFNI